MIVLHIATLKRAFKEKLYKKENIIGLIISFIMLPMSLKQQERNAKNCKEQMHTQQKAQTKKAKQATFQSKKETFQATKVFQ